MAVYKNVASQKIAIYAHDTSADAAKTGDAANITAQISKDGGATAATNDTNPTELDATDAPGIYIFDMTQAETNADMIILAATSSTPNISIETAIIYTTPGDSTAIDCNVKEVSDDSAAADNMELDYDGTGYAKTNSTIGTVTDVTNEVSADITKIAGSATVDAVSIANWAKRLYVALVRPFTGDATNRTKAFKDNANSTEFTHTYNETTGTRSLS